MGRRCSARCCIHLCARSRRHSCGTDIARLLGHPAGRRLYRIQQADRARACRTGHSACLLLGTSMDAPDFARVNEQFWRTCGCSHLFGLQTCRTCDPRLDGRSANQLPITHHELEDRCAQRALLVSGLARLCHHLLFILATTSTSAGRGIVGAARFTTQSCRRLTDANREK